MTINKIKKHNMTQPTLKGIERVATWASQEYVNHLLELESMSKAEFDEYAVAYEQYREEEDRKFLKNNPPKKEVVEQLYARFDEKKHKLIDMPASQVCFHRDLLDPLNGILTDEEFHSIQYDAVLSELFWEYQRIHKDAVKEMYGVDDDYFENRIK